MLLYWSGSRVRIETLTEIMPLGKGHNAPSNMLLVAAS